MVYLSSFVKFIVELNNCTCDATWVGKCKMASKDDIDDAFDSVVFLEERYIDTHLIP